MNIFKSWLVDKQIANKGIFDNVTIPENTLSSFEEAINRNYAISFSVHVISDGTVVVFADSQLSRLTKKDGYIHNLTAKDLPSTYLLNTAHTIPSLSQVLQLVNNRTPLLIEVISSNKNVGKDEAIIYNYDDDSGIYLSHADNEPDEKEKEKDKDKEDKMKNEDDERDGGEETIADVFNTLKEEAQRPKLPSSHHSISTLASPHFGSFDIEKLSSLKAKLFTHQNKPIICICSFACSQQAYQQAFSKSDNVIFEKTLPQI